MKISVIIPSYKPKKYIRECLNSLSAQTMAAEEWELIIVLNGCNAPYRQMIEALLCKFEAVHKLIQTDKGGVSNARNIGIEAATGEYIAFIDDDDYVSPTYLSELYRCASPIQLSLSATIAFYDESGQTDSDYYIAKDYQKLTADGKYTYYSLTAIRRYLNGPCMKLIHKNMIGGRRFDIQLTNGEDSLFMFLLSDKIKAAKFTSSNAVYYRRKRESSATANCQSATYRFCNGCRLICKFTKVYLQRPLSYNIPLYITRVLAVVKTILTTQSMRT